MYENQIIRDLRQRMRARRCRGLCVASFAVGLVVGLGGALII